MSARTKRPFTLPIGGLHADELSVPEHTKGDTDWAATYTCRLSSGRIGHIWAWGDYCADEIRVATTKDDGRPLEEQAAIHEDPDDIRIVSDYLVAIAVLIELDRHHAEKAKHHPPRAAHAEVPAARGEEQETRGRASRLPA